MLPMLNVIQTMAFINYFDSSGENLEISNRNAYVIFLVLSFDNAINNPPKLEYHE